MREWKHRSGDLKLKHFLEIPGLPLQTFIEVILAAICKILAIVLLCIHYYIVSFAGEMVGQPFCFSIRPVTNLNY